jgi:ABC-2 type transport system permease protein
MMINIQNIITVAKREYFTVVKKKSFWISTLLLPVFILVVGFVSGYSSQQAQESMEEVKEFDEGTRILVLDETGTIKEEFYKSSEVFEQIESKGDGIEEVKQANVEAFFYYPVGIFTGEEKVEVYRQNENIIENSNYNSTAVSIINQSVLSELTPKELAVSQGSISAEVIAYENGQVKEGDFTRLIVPGLGVIIYFLMVVFGMNYLLSSVSEEKESRMIEILLTSISSKSLLIGKLIGLLGVIFTQLLLLAAFALVGIVGVRNQLPIDISLSDLLFDPIQIGFAILCVIIGFLILANVMVGVGSAMPSLKEAQSFSSIFIILTVFPMYFAGLLLTDPDSSLAKTLSFVPITAPLILLFRNAFNVLTPLEMVLALIALVVQLVVSVYLAVKLFEIGSLEYKEKISLERVWGVIRG